MSLLKVEWIDMSVQLHYYLIEIDATTTPKTGLVFAGGPLRLGKNGKVILTTAAGNIQFEVSSEKVTEIDYKQVVEMMRNQ